MEEDRAIREQFETQQIELKAKEKETEKKMIELKIKELKRTIQSTYVEKAPRDNYERKKSSKSFKRPRENRPINNPRPSSSKRKLAQEIRRERDTKRREIALPQESQNANKGVDFNGGNDDSFYQEYDEEFEEVNEKPLKVDKSNLLPHIFRPF